MRFLKIPFMCMALMAAMATAASASDIFSVKTALATHSTQNNCGISMLSGETLEFSADDLELRLGLKPQSLAGITMTRLPKPEHGTLVLDGVDVDTFDFINRDDIDKLCFVSSEASVAASMMFIPRAEDTSTTELEINVMAEPNLPPVIQSSSVETSMNIAVSGYIQATDSEDDEMSVRVVKAPNNGVVRFDGLSFQYAPYKDFTGKDSFTVCVVDSMNNFSKQAMVSVNVEKSKFYFGYADMQMHPSAYAAIKLHENDVMSGIKIGKNYFFSPDNETSRGEFFVMLIAASGLEDLMKPTVNTGLPNDADIPHYLKPYVKKAIDEDIWAETQPFYHDKTPARAEAVVLADRAAKIKDVRDFELQMLDIAELPNWAVASYKNLAAYRMLDLFDNMARPAEPLTNSYSADLLWQIWKYCNK